MSYLATAKEALSALRAGRDPEPKRCRGPEPDVTQQLPTPKAVAAMTLDEFARAGLKVRVHSQVLACDVLFVSDNVSDDEIDARGLPVYRAQELKKLALMKPQPHSLRCIHEVKAVFKGTIEEIGDE
ncbi:MAG: hypothetical protein HC897_00920 [Thermoanaerobaculia bacterium]|nr:hypothetical protein [Thermoanaerobaculia bacterium]